MKSTIKLFVILILIVFLNIITSINTITFAQFTTEATSPKAEKAQQNPESISLIKEAVSIDETTLFYIGAKDKISVKQRILDIKSSINNVINDMVTNKKNFIDIEIFPVADDYSIKINDTPILDVTDIDAEVNTLEKEKLAQVWKSNIIQYIKEKIKNTSPNKIKNPLETITMALIIFILLIGLAELFRVQISKLIILFVEKLFRKLDFVINNIKKKKQEPEIITSQKEKEIETEASTAIEDSIITEEIPENKLDKRISVISNEIKGLINILIRIIEVILCFSFVDFILYTLPTTNAYVKDFTHFIISLSQVATESLSKWLLSEYTWEAFGRILIIIVITSIIIYISRILGSALENIIQTLLEEDKGRAKRVQTITKIVRTTLNILIIILAIVLILSELGVNIAPIIAGAGIIGLAISFGSQSLVKDILNGIFILIENQFGIGDVITIGGISGAVEDMTLRVTVLRDLNGRAHIIPNSQVTTVTVLTKDWSRINLDIGIAYKEDVDTAINIIKDVANKMHTEFSEKIIAEPEVLGVNCLNNSSVDIKIIIKTKAGEQWALEREFKRRIKYAFDENNIEIPFPHTTLYVPQPVGYDKN